MIPALKKISKVLTTIMKYCMVVLFIWMVGSLGVQVVARYVFGKGIVWSLESARYCMIWMIFIGSAEIIFNDDHIKVTILEDMLKGAGKRILSLIQDVISLAFSVMLAYYSFPQVALASKSVSANIDISMGIVYGIFPVATILMCVGYIFRIILLFADRDQESKPEKGGNDQ